jgi:poly-gamma-glutamate synthesis protein (capsule biosynthesis protein)
VQIVPPEELAETAWAQRPAWAILPFEALEPRWKVLSVDGVSPLQHDFDPSTYALSVPFALTSPTGLFDLNLPAGNRDANQLTIVDVTGVTALVRGTALWMERYGITYPAQDIGSILASADLTHISNEIPFTPDCPYPELYPTGMVFCSSPTYIDLLQAVGADIIELTGDHFSDWGPEAMYYTLSTYQDHNMQVYGGGINAEQARSATLVEHNGNKLAFIGCNIGCEVKPQVPCDALATSERPGAAQCDFTWLRGEITRLSNLGYQVIFTFQHREEYTYSTTPILADDFGQVAQMGAVIVSGSQAHQPHGFAYQDRAFIHYGLGNLFFDQYHFCADFACDYAFIDRHIFYAGRHISTELIPIKFIDLARARLMTPEEAARFLQIIFSASGW